MSIGDDTDTVAAIAGALLGARYGASGLPVSYRRRVHGWPTMRGHDLVELALGTARGGATHGEWPQVDSMVTHGRRRAARVDGLDGVVLGTEADLANAHELGCTGVVSLSRIGFADRRPAGVAPEHHVEMWLVDSDEPDDNAHLAWTLHDAADAVAELRAAGRDVLLHCVRAEHRTPSVALLYAVKHAGLSVDAATRSVQDALGVQQVGGLLWNTALAEARELRA